VDPGDEEKTQSNDPSVDQLFTVVFTVIMCNYSGDEETIDPVQMVRYPGFNYYDRTLDDVREHTTLLYS